MISCHATAESAPFLDNTFCLNKDAILYHTPTQVALIFPVKFSNITHTLYPV